MHPKQFITTSSQPVVKRWFVKKGKTVELGCHPIAVAQHVKRNHGIAPFIGVTQWTNPCQGQEP